MAESAHDGWYLLETNLPVAKADAPAVQNHYKNLLEVEEAFCELKSYLRVRPVFHYEAERVLNYVRLCFLANWILFAAPPRWAQLSDTAQM